MKVYLDFETFLIEPGKQFPKPVALGIAYDNDPPQIVLRKDCGKLLTELLDVAMHDGCKIYAHNAGFDFGVMCAEWSHLGAMVFAAYKAGAIECSMYREVLHDIALEGRVHERGGYYTLAQCYNRWTGQVMPKDDTRLMYAGLDDIPTEEWPARARDYLELDVTGLRDVVKEQDLAVQHDPEIFLDSPAQARAYFALGLAGGWGLRTDGEAAANLRKSIEAQRTEVAGDLVKIGILRAKGSCDTAVLKGLVQEALGEAVPRTDPSDKFPQGQIKTDIETIKEAVAFNPKLKLYQTYKEDANTLKTFIPQLELGALQPLHPHYWMTKAGRTSCRKPNIQQQPRKPGVRECFVPRPGYVFASADYGAMEMGTLAQVCIWLFGWSRLADAINAGVDTHIHLASELRHRSYELTTEMYLKGDTTVKADRDISKVGNFGFAGGMGVPTFVTYANNFGIDITVEESKKIRDTWLTTWPEMPEFFDWVSDQVGQMGGTLHQAVSKRRRGQCGYTDGCNTMFQGLAADAAKAACFNVQAECYVDQGSALFGSRLVAFIHDELILESPLDRAPEAADRLAKVMVDTLEYYTPDVKGSAEPLLMDRWSKKAKPIRDAAGRLQIYYVGETAS